MTGLSDNLNTMPRLSVAHQPLQALCISALLRLFKKGSRRASTFSISMFSIIMLFSIQQLSAQCTRTTRLHSIDNAAAAININQLNLSDQFLQPAGTVLASKTVMPTAYNFMGAQGNTVLWQCDEEDLENVYFLVATNGDDRLGGYWEMGREDGLDHVYATWWQNVGIRQSMAGVILTRIWQKVPIQSYLRQNNKISIRVMDIPPLEVSLIKINQLPPESGSGSNYCENMGSSGNYSCTQPSAYIQLSGDAVVSIRFNHDNLGEDANNYYEFYGANNGFGYTLRGSGPLVQSKSCFVRSATPVVQFSPISADALNQGQTAVADLNVHLECNTGTNSGTDVLQTALSFQASAESHRAAQDLGLVNSNGASAYLVSEAAASNANMATGVGMRIQNNANAKFMQFMPPSANSGGGEATGWYPVLDGNPSASTSALSGYNSFMQSYRAILQSLPGKTATAGLFKAKATVVVKVQ